jgi:LysR family hydrogen peroxide-inducible transcriptional activator
MTLQQLEYVIAVYRNKHFGQAAEYCNVTQPTLSAMIQKLEEELGVKIFDRQSKPLKPTPEGQLIIEQAWKVLVRARKLKEIVAEEKQSLSGTFNIAILPTVAPYLIPLFLPKLMNSHPETDIRVTEMKTDDMKKALLHGDMDAGIAAMTDGMDDMKATLLYYEQFFAYVSRNDKLFENERIRTADLQGEYLWLLDEGHCFGDQMQHFCHLKAAARSKKAYTSGSIETFMRIVESGKGVTFIPELATLQLSPVQKELVKPFALPVPTRQIVMLTGKSFIRKTLLQLIIDEIRTAVPTGMLTLKSTQKKV